MITNSIIDGAFLFLKNEINTYLNQKIGKTSEDKVILDDVTKIATDIDLNNRIILSLVNMEEDRISRSSENYVKIDDRVVYKNPKVNLNMYCLFTVNRDKDYSGALKNLSLVIQFFQYKNVFTHENSPALDDCIEKLIIDLYSLSFEQLNHLWGILGGKYLPSVMYKVRMITIEEGSFEAEGEPIKEIVIDDKDYTH